MPSIRSSANPNLEGWQPSEPGKPADAAAGIPPSNLGRSSMMLASMPLMASTGDALERQFYGAGNLPMQRILPAKKGSGS